MQTLCHLLLQDSPPTTTPLPDDLITLAQTTRTLHLLATTPTLRPLLPDKARKIVLAQAARGALLLEEFRRISHAMASRGIPIAPLKGMAYALMFEQGGPLTTIDGPSVQ